MITTASSPTVDQPRSFDAERSSRIVPGALASCFYVLAGLAVGLAYTQFDYDSFGNADSSMLASLHGQRPYQYRVLLLALAHVLCPILHVTARHVFDVFDIAFAMLIPFAFRRLLSSFLDDRFATALGPLVLYAVFVDHCLLCHIFFVYDFAAIFFFIAGVHLILTKQWQAYYLLFIAASINRETSAFLCVALALVWFGRLPSRQLASHLAASMVIWAAIHLAIVHLFRHNHGMTADLSLGYNLDLVKSLLHGNLKLMCQIVGFAGGLWLMMPLYWNRQPVDLRRLAWIALPIFAGMTVVGRLNEMRIYSELLVVISAVAACALVEAYRTQGARLPNWAVPAAVACVVLALAGGTYLCERNYRHMAVRDGATFLSDIHQGAFEAAISMISPDSTAPGMPRDLPVLGQALSTSAALDEIKPRTNVHLRNGYLVATSDYDVDGPKPVRVTLDMVYVADGFFITGYHVENR